MINLKKYIIGTTKKQSVEFGLVTILVTILLAIYFKQNYFVLAALLLTLITLLVPIVFSPFAAFWFWLSKILSLIGSRVFLTIVFFIVVTPVGMIRRLLKRDSLKIDHFKKSTKSVMTDRDHLYTAGDFTDTF
jgi:predicted membrane metal-binding protein